MKKQPAPLIIEQHPKEYTGFPFITLIQYHKMPLLCIVDNADANVVRTFVLDMCGPAEVNEELVVMAAQEWYNDHSKQYPVSVHFARVGISDQTSKIYRSINVEFVSRAIGPVPVFPMTAVKSVKRRRRKPLSPSIEIHQSNVVVIEELFNRNN